MDFFTLPQGVMDVLNQILLLIITSVIAAVGEYTRRRIKQSTDVAAYSFKNDAIERIMSNAVAYAEDKYRVAEKVPSTGPDKLLTAMKYVDDVTTTGSVVSSSDITQAMIERKVAELRG